MIYWLFTQGRVMLSALTLPLLCLGVAAPLTFAALLGVGIQRRAEGTPLHTQGVMRVVRVLSFVLPSLAVVTLYVSLLGGMAVSTATTHQAPLHGMAAVIIGGTRVINQPRLAIFGFGLFSLLVLLNMLLWQGIRSGGWLRERIDRLRRPNSPRGEMGSAHFCTRREYIRFRRQDSDGVTFLGAFWGENHLRLDVGWGKFCLSGEDAARGILTIGAPGSGKSQGVVLPVIADRMRAGHSLIIADPQGELTAHILRFARCTRHLVVVHDPTSRDGPRFNLAEGIDSIPAAHAIAKVLIPSAQGDNRFWTDSAADLLSACLIRFDTLGQIKASLDDLGALARKLSAKRDDAALAASAFIASVGADGKVASNTIATLGTALTGWASAQVRANTNASDFDATLIVDQPTVVVLTCPGAMRDVYAPYLGAVLRKLMRDLDAIGEQAGGPLPMPVGIILDEFPTLGRLDGLVADVNLVRKRRISILIAAQTKGQFHLIYGEEGTKALFTGLATQIVYGGGDHDTAKFYSEASGLATVDVNPDPHKANLRQRALLTTDELVNPQDGSCHIFSRFVQGHYAAQVILKAQLTRFYEREDWREWLRRPVYAEPLRVERRPTTTAEPPPLPDPQPKFSTNANFEQQALDAMRGARERTQTGLAATAGVHTLSTAAFKRQHADQQARR
ncbi:MAG: type IV secretory system conjugative DNA transfer family protein [Chloroflexota bacterium]